MTDFTKHDIVTNGYMYDTKKRAVLHFEVLAVDRGDVWVRQLNGAFAGEALTFKAEDVNILHE